MNEVFNPDVLLQTVMNDRTIVRKILLTFVEDIPLRIEALTQALIRADAHSARIEAHSIKGACASVGGAGLRVLALSVERCAVTGQLDVAATMLPQLTESFNVLSRAIGRYLDDLDQG